MVSGIGLRNSQKLYVVLSSSRKYLYYFVLRISLGSQTKQRFRMINLMF
jgi:hypothetical protein